MLREIIDEGFYPSVTEQLVKHFGDVGTIAIYFRATSQPEIMLTSTDPITDDIYTTWCKENMEECDT